MRKVLGWLWDLDMRNARQQHQAPAATAAQGAAATHTQAPVATVHIHDEEEDPVRFFHWRPRLALWLQYAKDEEQRWRGVAAAVLDDPRAADPNSLLSAELCAALMAVAAVCVCLADFILG